MNFPKRHKMMKTILSRSSQDYYSTMALRNSAYTLPNLSNAKGTKTRISLKQVMETFRGKNVN
jgi:hypothetical protein